MGGSFTAFMASKLGSANLLPMAVLAVLAATSSLHLAARDIDHLAEDVPCTALMSDEAVERGAVAVVF